MSTVGGMVLAAGLSERMKGKLPKQLLPVGDITLAALAVRHAEASRLYRVVVVTGYRGAEVAASVAGGRAEVVHNPDFRRGNMTSFRVGAQSLDDCEAVVVLLADMPGVTPEMIDRIVGEWERAHPWAAISSYHGGPAHPLLLSRAALDKAVEAEGSKAVWRFLETISPDRVERIPFDRAVPLDVNTAAEYDLISGEFPASG
jgi:molybdenum cofactor cytidylyltransferase